MKKGILKVEKRKGKIENFDPAKIKKVVITAGLNTKQADKLLANIQKWAKGLDKKPVSSIRIRDRVAQELKKIDEYAHKKYVWWQEYKGKHLV